MQLSWSSGKLPLFYSTAIFEARQGKRDRNLESRDEIRPLTIFFLTRSFLKDRHLLNSLGDEQNRVNSLALLIFFLLYSYTRETS